jgi:hypothetical protein
MWLWVFVVRSLVRRRLRQFGLPNLQRVVGRQADNFRSFHPNHLQCYQHCLPPIHCFYLSIVVFSNAMSSSHELPGGSPKLWNKLLSCGNVEALLGVSLTRFGLQRWDLAPHFLPSRMIRYQQAAKDRLGVQRGYLEAHPAETVWNRFKRRGPGFKVMFPWDRPFSCLCQGTNAYSIDISQVRESHVPSIYALLFRPPVRDFDRRGYVKRSLVRLHDSHEVNTIASLHNDHALCMSLNYCFQLMAP